MAVKYPDVKFIKVDIERNEDIAAPRSISSIPTFHFILRGQLVDEMKGANPVTLEQKVQQHKVSLDPFGGSTGHKLSTPGGHEPALSAREARLKAFAALEGTHKQPAHAAPAAGSVSTAVGSGSGAGVGAAKMDVEVHEEEEALVKALQLSTADDSKPAAAAVASTAAAVEYAAAEAELDAQDAANAGPLQHFTAAPGQEWEEEMVPVPVNQELLDQLNEMGFTDVRGRKGLVHGGSLDGALAWLSEHQDDADIDQPYLVKKSDTLPKPPLSEEEKKARQAAIQVRYSLLASVVLFCYALYSTALHSVLY